MFFALTAALESPHPAL